MRQVQGKELSWNNLLDADAARKLVALFDEPAVVIVKHNNPCGVGRGAGPRRRLRPRPRVRPGLRLRLDRGGEPPAHRSAGDRLRRPLHRGPRRPGGRRRRPSPVSPRRRTCASSSVRPTRPGGARSSSAASTADSSPSRPTASPRIPPTLDLSDAAASPRADRAAGARVRLGGDALHQVERDRARCRRWRPHPGRRRRPDEPGRLLPDRDLEGPLAARRLGRRLRRLLPVPRRPRRAGCGRASPRSSSPAAAAATTSSSPRPTSTAWR